MSDLLIKPDGEIEEVDTPNNRAYTLKEMQTVVGGYVQLVYLPGGRVMMVDEEGLYKNYKYNEKASQMAGQSIVGTVLVTNRNKIN
jgi:hypothetical protein